MRIGVFGGTFDPIHLGHLLLAEQCREQGQLDQVWFVPSARPPHKDAPAISPFAQRVEMLQLAIAGQPAFRVDELEKDRPGPSFTVDTLESIHQRQPQDELFLLLGSDSLHDLPHWYEPDRIVRAATLLVMARSDWVLLSAEELHGELRLPPEVPVRLQVVQVPLIGIASRDLRRRAESGRSFTLLLPRAVEAYIHDKLLYPQR